MCSASGALLGIQIAQDMPLQVAQDIKHRRRSSLHSLHQPRSNVFVFSANGPASFVWTRPDKHVMTIGIDKTFLTALPQSETETDRNASTRPASAPASTGGGENTSEQRVQSESEKKTYLYLSTPPDFTP